MQNSTERDIGLDLMLQAAAKLGEFSVGYDFDKFLSDTKTQSAIIMQFIVIGELSKKLPEEIKKRIDLPWKFMADFRNFAVHEYFELDLKQVWDSVINDIPIVEEKLQAYLKEKS